MASPIITLMADDTYDEDEVEAEPERRSIPLNVLAPAIVFGFLALVTGFAAVVNLGAGHWDLTAGVLPAAVAVAAAVTTVAMLRGARLGSYLGFGLALLLALASLRNVGTVVVGVGFLAMFMGCLSTRSAKDWFGFR